MTPTGQRRLTVFALILATVALTVGWALRNAWKTLEDVERLDSVFKAEVGQDVKTLADIQQQFAGIADHVTNAMNELNNSLLAFVLRNDQRELANYRDNSQALRDWIRQREASVIQMELILNTQPTFRAN